MDDKVASVQGIIDLSPLDALDEAQSFLTQQGYTSVRRAGNSLTVERHLPDQSAEREALRLSVAVASHPGGGVRMVVRGNDRQGVQERQGAWMKWSESLPKKPEEESQPTDPHDPQHDPLATNASPAPESPALLNRLLGGTSEERAQKKQLGPLVGLACEEALEQATAYLTRRGASVVTRSENSISFTYHKGPNVLILAILLVFLLLPGILYWLAASRDVHFTITASPAAGGCRLLFGGEYGAGYNEFQYWLKRAPAPNHEITASEEAAPPQQNDLPASIPAQIRELAELRTAGILSQEEFEAKKTELLKRL